MTEEKEATKNTEKNEITKDKVDRVSSIHFILTSLLFLAFICLIFYTKQLNTKQDEKLTQKINKLSAKQESQASDAIKNIKDILAAEKLKINKINKQINAALKESPYKTNDWLMQKARYYLELANINNKWTNDFQTTQSLLAGADRTLKNLTTDDIIEVRKIIAEEELSVATANKLDIMKVLTELHAIANSLNELKIKKPCIDSTQSTIDKDEKNDTAWQKHFKKSLGTLNQLVIIRRTDDTPIQKLTPKYQAAVRANLQLNIQQMQWAVISRNQDVFKLSCKQALDSIKLIYNTDEPHTKVVIEKLEKIDDTDLTLTKANIGRALRDLEKLIVDTNAVDEG